MITGRQINLGKDKTEATRTFHGLLSEESSRRQLPSRLTVAKLADLWLQHNTNRVAVSTWRNYQTYAQSLVDSCGRQLVSQLRPHHVTRWIEEHSERRKSQTGQLLGWNRNTQAAAISVAKLIMSWGLHEGLIERNPIATVRRPGCTRRPPTSQANFSRLLDGIRSDEFRQFLVMALETGCRPGELVSLTAANISEDGQTAIVSGKTKQRRIYLSSKAREILQPLQIRYPTGPLLRNTQGGEWTIRGIGSSFERAGLRVGVKVVPYQIRGLFASLALRRGVDSLLVSKLLGHVNGTALLAKHYANIEDDQLIAAIDRATSVAMARPPTPASDHEMIPDTLPHLAPDTAQPRDEAPGDTAADPSPRSSARRIR